MNGIVETHFPAAKLPVELREGLDPGQMATVTISVEEAPPEKVPTLEELFSLRRPPFRSGREIDDELRRQRDEWDD